MAGSRYAMVLGALLAVGVCGCGRTSSGDSERITFKAQVIEICRDAESDAEQAVSGRSTVAVGRAVIDARTTALSSLVAVIPPSAEVANFRRFRAALAQRNEAQREFITALRAGDRRGFRRAETAMNHHLVVAQDALSDMGFAINDCLHL